MPSPVPDPASTPEESPLPACPVCKKSLFQFQINSYVTYDAINHTIEPDFDADEELPEDQDVMCRSCGEFLTTDHKEALWPDFKAIFARITNTEDNE